MKYYVFLLLFTVGAAYSADSNELFISLAKKTSSNVSGVTQVDLNNPEKSVFETLIDNQKILLTLSSLKMNSGVYTVINANGELAQKSKKSLPSPPVVIAGDLNISIDSKLYCSENGVLAQSTDTSCEGKKCNLKQLVIAKCNESNCWRNNSEVDRQFGQGLSGEFSLVDKVDVSGCLINNNEGVKHDLVITETQAYKGATVRYQIIIMNDKAGAL